MELTREFLRAAGLPGEDPRELPSSIGRFPDGAAYRTEIPSVEGPEALAAVLAEADQRAVPVHRVSQGSGGLLLTQAELRTMAELGAAAGIEVSLFARPLAGWDVGAASLAPGAAGLGAQARGVEQLVHVLEDIRRMTEAGIRGTLVTDLGVLSIAAQMRAAGELPADLRFKTSVQMGLANPASIRIAARLGADSYNVPTDLSLAQIAAVRAAVDIPIDLYVEAPDDLGGFVRHFEIAEIVRVAAPVYLKFGLRGAPNIYPAGTHLTATAIALGRERVRRAEIGLELLHRYAPDLASAGSVLPAADLAVPAPTTEATTAPTSQPVPTTEPSSTHTPAVAR
ncbi:Peptidase family U32 [Parafrankia irregularis]|uniref:Peptidase family U32 n=1 Tax=Parafrankia irregularis TaxID=795642 RepID=A0A0S4QI40_9ACTN|nr:MULTISPECIES: U32 family peptidase [Parafrankia]MBE3200737.1 U32 family peptidase [Parafrankia sp. CH37]CUU54878.1 Peptidase family U32 [Parafrankia irregularis]